MKKIFYISVALSLLTAYSCTKNHSKPADPVIAPTIKGVVSLVNENDVLTSDNTGSTVTVENSNPLIVVSVDAKGAYELPHLQKTSATIVLRFEHNGFGTIKTYITPEDLDNYQVAHIGGPQVVLHPLSRVVVNNTSAAIANDTLTIHCNVTVPAGSKTNYISWLNLRNDADVSVQNALGYRVYPVTDGDNTIKLCMCSAECSYYKNGDTMYGKAVGFVSPLIDGYAYVNYSNNKVVLTCANDNNLPVLAITVP
jgi:hypothetical protein